MAERLTYLRTVNRMEQRSPLFIVFFMIGVGLMLASISFLFPEGDRHFRPEITLKYPSIDKLLDDDEPQYAAIDALLSVADSLEEIADDTAAELRFDTISLAFNPKKPREINVDSLLKAGGNLHRIQFPDQDPKSLFSFFDQLNAAATKGTSTHVFYYGDSQIEGDRMSSYIRYKLQQRFGGGGVGMLSLSNLLQVPFVGQENSNNWNRYNIFSKDWEASGNRNFGALCSYSAYTPYPLDSSLEAHMLDSAFVRYDAGKALFKSGKTFQRVRLFYGPVFDAVKVDAKVSDTAFTYYLKGMDELNVYEMRFKEPQSVLEMQFHSRISPQFFGLTLENTAGVFVDNVAMRGGSGTVFYRSDPPLLSAMLKELNTSLIIMQFGGNVLPYIKDSAQCEQYGRWFYSQIALLQKACPQASILVVGPADMSVKQEEYYVTYPLLELVRDELRRAAFRAGVGFWDMYGAMGGNNSMPSWVAAQPPLAGTDYTHFTPRGARVISEFLYEAIMYEYELYQSQPSLPNSSLKPTLP